VMRNIQKNEITSKIEPGSQETELEVND
jgi:hypothetical protein